MKALTDLLGDSPGIRAVRDKVARLLERQQEVRRLPPILIQGETGSGKGLLARMIHRAGPRPDGPFVDVNCAAIPDTLLEAEMFGFERGAFTDARRSKPGLFQAAHRGTIFLDEVGLLPEALQAKLLKVLEERSVRRLGATRDEPIDVWILTATNEDLRAAMRERRFREDLYHRLAVLTVMLPPLRERGDDVVALAEHFLARVCVDYGVARRTLAPGAVAALRAYAWPGNVRELSNVIERAVLQSSSDELTAEALGVAEDPAAAAPARTETVSLDDAMRQHLVDVLGQTRGNISRTAALLGISRNTLRARMDRYRLRERETAPRPAARPRVVSTPPAASAPAAARPSVVPAPASGRRWERRRIALLRAALVPPARPEATLETARALEEIVEKVRTFGGRVEGIGPIGLVAAFGLDAVGDAADRAAHAALAMVKAVERARRDKRSEVAVKLGVHATPALVSLASGGVELDMDERRDLWPLLDELVERAPLDGITVIAVTAPLLTRRFGLAPGAGPAGGAPTQLLVGRERTGLGPGARMVAFVGRQHELELLESRLASAVRGQGQVVGLGGEAGIGKSRLVYEFRQTLAARDVDCLEAQCLSYGSVVPYLPVLDLLRAACRLSESDTPEVTSEKLRRALEELGLDGGELAPYLLHALGVKEGSQDLAVQNHEALKTRIFEVLRQSLRRRARQRPLVLVVEDLHWIDATSQEFFDSLVDGLAGTAIVLICTYRPGYRPPWIEKSYATQVALQPLDAGEARRVVRGVLGEREVPDALVDLILAKAEGNAFFLEELALAMRDPGGIEQPVVPDTVQDVLLTRIDRLPAAERGLLRSAAVIGKDFPVSVLQAIAGVAAEAVRRGLAHLEGLEFVHESGGSAEPEYTFKHALTHEVAYGSVAEDERSSLHARILHELERLYGERIGEHLDHAAHHAVRGAVWDKAFAYLRRAGVKAYADGAHREAVACFERALAALGQLPPTSEQIGRAIDLRFELRTALLPLGEVERGLQYVREAERLADELGDPRRLAQLAAYRIGQLYFMGAHAQAWEAGQRALELRDTFDDVALRVTINTYLGQVLHSLGDYRRAADFFRANVEALVGEQSRERFGLPQLPSVHSRTCLVWALVALGDFRQAMERAGEAVAIAETADQPLSRTVAYAGLGVAWLGRGDAARAISVLEPALALIREWNIPLWFPRVASALALAYARAGREADGGALAERAVERASAMRLVGGLSLLVGNHAAACLAAGQVSEAAVLAARALALAREHGERGYEARASRVAGAAATRQGDVVTSAAALAEALKLAEGLGMQPLVGQCHVDLARVKQQVGDGHAAAAHLAAARAIFAATDMTGWTGRSDAELLESV